MRLLITALIVGMATWSLLDNLMNSIIVGISVATYVICAATFIEEMKKNKP